MQARKDHLLWRRWKTHGFCKTNLPLFLKYLVPVVLFHTIRFYRQNNVTYHNIYGTGPCGTVSLVNLKSLSSVKTYHDMLNMWDKPSQILIFLKLWVPKSLYYRAFMILFNNFNGDRIKWDDTKGTKCPFSVKTSSDILNLLDKLSQILTFLKYWFPGSFILN